MSPQQLAKLKLAVGIAAAICLTIFMLQNLQEVEISFLTITVVLPAAVLVVLACAVGAGLGYLLARRKRALPPAAESLRS